MNPTRTTPDALLIGMQRAGTTFLRRYFDIHPQINWGRNAIFFMTDMFLENPEAYWDLHSPLVSSGQIYIDAYEALAVGYFQVAMDSWGETDLVPNYSMSIARLPGFEEIPNRILSLLPNVKIILTIRSQMDWLRSNYLHHLSLLPPQRRTFSDFLSTPEGSRLLRAGFYTNIISAYQKIFGEHNVHVILLEHLNHQVETTLRRLCTFLNIDYAAYPSDLQNKNTGRTMGHRNLLFWLDRLGLDKQARRKLPKVQRINDWLSGTRKDPISEEQKSILYSLYAVENLRLSAMLDIDLSTYNYFQPSE